MVGYSKNKLVTIIGILDNYTLEDSISKLKIIMSLMKISIQDMYFIKENIGSIASFILILQAILLKKADSKKRTYAQLAEDEMSHMLNRALYGQKKYSSQDQFIEDLVSNNMNGRHMHMLSNLMVYADMDLDDMLIKYSTVETWASDGLYMSGPTVILEEIAYGCE